MTRTLITIIVTALLTVAAVNARVIHNPYVTGVAWDWGGFDVLPQPALFICPGSVDLATRKYTPNPLVPYFDTSYIVDC